jgi:SAM-dependent methyltransferase
VELISSFDEKYSNYYDMLYADKDYEKECDYLERLFQEFSTRRVRKILDIACGTGGHTIALAKRGYAVFARDLSPGMLSVARSKVESLGLTDKVRLEQGDMRSLSGTGMFDACLCMFASIGYLPSPEEALRAFEKMREHVSHGGLLIMDCWNGLAVLSVKPSRRVKRVGRDGLTVVRSATPRLDPLHDVCRVSYEVLVKKGSRKIDEFSELHSMRYFYPEGIRFLLKLAGFETLSLHPFLEAGRSVGVKDWNISIVARTG